MADIMEAFNTFKTQKKPFQNIDYFFTQRSLTEEHEYLDKHLVRKTKKVKVTNNFLALNIPTIITTTNSNGQTVEKPLGFDIEIFGDEGYHYKGSITSFLGIIPNFMIPIKGDKKLFVNINYKVGDSNDNHTSRKYVNFIEVPKRFQLTDDNESHVSNKENESDNLEV